ncbi:MAG: chemotaxis protein CheW, partial [Acidimicrobiia bacterium]|nr:chemotaxis protein CheW [Acidimicrobiia bacterium]
MQNDPDLESLFREELTERAASLAEGAQAVIDGAVTADLAGRMVREGHTIKGTGRVMGHEVIARGGETCEILWRWIQQDGYKPTPMLGRTLLMLSSSLVEALGGSSDGVNGAIDAIRSLVDDPTRLEELPEPLIIEEVDLDAVENMADVVELPQQDAAVQETAVTPAPEPAPAVTPPPPPPEETGPLVYEPGPDGKLQPPKVTVEIIRSAFAGGTERVAGGANPRPQPEGPPAAGAPTPSSEDAPPTEVNIDFLYEKGSIFDPDGGPAFGLGGLAGVVETWATEESVAVNAGRLYRLLNEVAALRVDLEALSGHAAPILRSADFRTLPGAEGALESLETARRDAAQLQEASLGLTAVSLASVTSTLPQMMRYLAKKTGKNVDLEVDGAATVVDRQLVDRIGEAIRQLIVNAVVHGIEYPDDRNRAGKTSVGTVKVSIINDGAYITIAVTDDGGGVDWVAVKETAIARNLVGSDPSTEELQAVLFAREFSTNPKSSEFTREGDGLARISQIVEEVFGSIEMTSSPQGSSFVITMPAQRSLQSARLFRAGGLTWGIPSAAVLATMPVATTRIDVSESGSTIVLDGQVVPYSSFSTAAGLEVEGLPAEVLVIKTPGGSLALAVDEVLGAHEVATKDLGPLLEGSTVVTGVALLGGDDTVLLVDAGRLSVNF